LDTAKQDGLYDQASAEHSGAVARLARAYEADVITPTIIARLGAAVLGDANWLNVRAANKLQQEIDVLGE